MSCASSPTPPAADAWCARLPSRHTKTGWRRTDISTWTTCANTRRPNYAKPHDQHHDRQFAELDAHNRKASGSRRYEYVTCGPTANERGRPPPDKMRGAQSHAERGVWLGALDACLGNRPLMNCNHTISWIADAAGQLTSADERGLKRFG